MHPKPTVSGTNYPTRVNAMADALDRRLKGNLLINGALQIWQRGTSFTPTTKAYTVDRWEARRAAGGAGLTVSQQTGQVATFAIRLQRNAANANVEQIEFAQSIETLNCRNLIGLPVTLKLLARKGADFSPTSSNFTLEAIAGTGSDQNVLTGFTGANAFATATVVAGTSQAIAEATGTVPAGTAQLGVRVKFTPTGTAATNDWLELEEIQLVIGDYAGNFPYRLYGEELQLCQRYFWKTFDDTVAPASSAGITGALGYVTMLAGVNNYSIPVRFPVPMRIQPTVTFYNPSAAGANWRNITAGANSGAASGLSTTLSHRGINVVNAQAAGDTVGQGLALHATADAEI